MEWRFGGFRIISRFVAEHKKKEHLTPIKPDKRFDMVEIEKRKIGYLETIDGVAPESKKRVNYLGAEALTRKKQQKPHRLNMFRGVNMRGYANE